MGAVYGMPGTMFRWACDTHTPVSTWNHDAFDIVWHDSESAISNVLSGSLAQSTRARLSYGGVEVQMAEMARVIG